jgi:hypothetical protein
MIRAAIRPEPSHSNPLIEDHALHGFASELGTGFTVLADGGEV